MTSDQKVKKAIQATEKFLNDIKQKNNGEVEYYDDCGKITIAGCESRNLTYYKQILGKNKRKLKGFAKELYQAI